MPATRPLATRLLIAPALICCALAPAAPRAGIRTIASGGRVETAAPGARAGEVRRVVHLDPPSAGASRYAYVPFEVPPGAARVSVAYAYDRAGDANTIDLGLFDARFGGADTDPRGFRGWSGGRRSEIFVARTEATPGYLAGELPAGTWRVILGLYRVAPAGVDVTFKISIETGEVRPPGADRRARAAANADGPLPVVDARAQLRPRGAVAGLRWWSGDLHMHTLDSDGDWTVAELAAAGRGAGLDFISVTDHNTSSHHAKIERESRLHPSPLILRGEEITTYGGHTNAWGLPAGAWIDFRTRPGDAARMSEIAARAHRAGALVSINHPFAACGGCAWTYHAAAPGFDAVEVWNGPWDETDERALAMWDGMLREGRRVTAVASTDSHRQSTPVGRPSIRVAAAELSEKGVLDAIRRGRVYLTGEPARPVLRFEGEAVGSRKARAGVGDEIRLRAPGAVRFLFATEAVPPDATVLLIFNGLPISLATAPDGRPREMELECRKDSYVRLEVRDKAGIVLALTNPIYVKVGKGREN